MDEKLMEAASAARRRADEVRTRTAEVLARAEDVIRRSRLTNVTPVQSLRDEVEGLKQAMVSRAAIEQAKGILMATARVDADRAFDLLRQQSQHENRKLRDIALDLIAQQQRPRRRPDSMAS